MPEVEVDRESEQFRKLFIGGLSYETTEEQLKTFYEQWGEVVDCIVMKDPHTKQSRGFGFVTYKKAHMVDDAQRERPHKIDKKEVESKRAMPREDAGKPEAHLTIKRVYVSGIKDDIEELDLKEYFSQFGNVEEVEVITDKETKKKRGFAFVTYDDYDCVDKVVLIRHHMIKNYRCDAKKAMSKEEMNNIRGGGSGGGRSMGRAPPPRRPYGSRDRYNDYPRDNRDRYHRGGRDDYRVSSGYGSGYGGRNYNERRGGWNRGYDDAPSHDRWSGGGSGGFGSGYGGSSGGGAMRSDSYGSRGSGPYGGSYGGGSGSSGGGYGVGGGQSSSYNYSGSSNYNSGQSSYSGEGYGDGNSGYNNESGMSGSYSGGQGGGYGGGAQSSYGSGPSSYGGGQSNYESNSSNSQYGNSSSQPSYSTNSSSGGGQGGYPNTGGYNNGSGNNQGGYNSGSGGYQSGNGYGGNTPQSYGGGQAPAGGANQGGYGRR